MKNKRPRGHRKFKGVSLPEMAVTVAVLSLLALVVGPLFMHASRFYIMNRTRVELQQEARAALTIMTKNLRQAQAPSISIDRLAGQPYYSRITFTKIDGSVIAYTQDGSRLVETVGARAKELTDDLRFLNFYFPRSDDMTIVSVSMTLEKGIFEKRTKALHVASEKVRVMD